MAKIRIRREHGLGREKARQQIEEVAAMLEQQLDAKCSWEADRLCFKRPGASGAVDVGDDYLEFDISLGMLLTPLKGKIETMIEEELDKALG